MSSNPNPLSPSAPDKPLEPTRARIDGEEGKIKLTRELILSSFDGAGDSIKLPEKYEVLGEFFKSLDCSIWVCKSKGSRSTFANLCPIVESLTERKFTYGQLAQLKYILPEAIELQNVLVFDEKIRCMTLDIHINLNVNVIEVDDDELKCWSKPILLRKAFWARLLDFCKDHPEGDEVPEGVLPMPFDRLGRNRIPGEVKSLQKQVFNDDDEEKEKITGDDHTKISFFQRFPSLSFLICGSLYLLCSCFGSHE